MKQFNNILKFLLLALLIHSCSDSDKVIDGVFDDVESGAVLRTISVNNATLNSSEPDSEFSVTIEEQDAQDGSLLESVDVHVTMNDLTPDNGESVADDVFVKSIPASMFEPGPFGLPRATLNMTFSEAVSAMGFTPADYAPGDSFVVDLKLNLTDGRQFNAENTASVVSGGFFSSPFRYNTLIICSPAPGDYTIDMHDSYGDGWQTTASGGGPGITIDVDGTIIEFGMCSPYGSGAGTFLGGTDCTGPASTSFFDATTTITIPAGAQSAIWNFPGDFWSEISFEVYAPDGSLIFASGSGEASTGILPIVVCAQ